MIYLDNNATTRPSAAVVAAMHRALEESWANPSSVHRAGQAAHQQVELARRDAADLIGAKPREIIFTSGGTEAVDLAIRGVLTSLALRTAPTRPAPPAIVSTRTEHAAVRDLLEDLEKRGLAEVRWAPVNQGGLIDRAALEPLLPGAALLAVQWANNETGAVHPVRELGEAARRHGVLFLCDGTQWVGKEHLAVGDAPIDLLTFSPHKFHGPKGVGILWTRRGVPFAPQIHGSQELGRRGGTENVPGIVGAGVACREALQWLADPRERPRLTALRDRFEAAILAAIPDAVVNGPKAPSRRLWNTTNIGFPRLEAEALLLLLSERGLCASAGAACSSGSLEPSPVLLAMGIPPEVAHGSLRFSLSRDTAEAEIDAAIPIVIDAVRQLRRSLAITA